ncbi:LysR family transcriptional regulator [Clostridium sp. PL3]|uniref:LysR family transcriptional regulator n=1 Tax=Clostridium thailandense TaxID=2794346 RepID=A0A949TT09_9CLOT|nr:LysR family transcriptional regulator [Clostridium thailandense]MBV7275972.1 LysR family transcriptional regulator [Clostridium thailandense]
MQLKQLEYFYVLAKMEHCTKAAEKLYITQPSLSHAISELEKELGTQLFQKEGRNIHLNKYGQTFFPHVEKALTELKIGEKKMLELLYPNKGNIDLGYLYNLGDRFVPKVITAFLNNTDYKDTKFSFGQGNTPNLIDSLKKEKFDFVFCSYVENEPNIDFFPVIQEDLVVIVPKAHPLAKFKSVTLEQLSSYPFVAFSHKSGLRPIIDNVFKSVNITPNIVAETEIDTSVAGLVETNFGVAIITNIPALKDFNIKILKLKNANSKRLIYLAKIKDKHLSPAMDSFQSFVIKYQNENNLSIYNT